MKRTGYTDRAGIVHIPPHTLTKYCHAQKHMRKGWKKNTRWQMVKTERKNERGKQWTTNEVAGI